MSSEVFVEMELHGPSDQAVAFIDGFRHAAGARGPIWFAGRERIKLDDFLDTLRQTLQRGTHVILRKQTAQRIAEALAESTLLSIKVESIEEIDYCELSFEYRCYSQGDGCDVRRVVEQDLPEEVRLEGYRHEEEIDESAKGPELYSPAHHYTLHGRGRYVGPVAGIIEMAHRLTDQDFIHPAKIRLHHPR